MDSTDDGSSDTNVRLYNKYVIQAYLHKKWLL